MGIAGVDIVAAEIKRDLQRLRQNAALAEPDAVLKLSLATRERLTSPPEAGDVIAVVTALRHRVAGLAAHVRRYVEVELNWDAGHHYMTLTERQESLAQELGCASKTVRRHADKALGTLALHIAGGEEAAAILNPGGRATETPQLVDEPSRSGGAEDSLGSWQGSLRDFWQLTSHSRVDIVCSEIPEEERPEFADPHDRNYLRYAKFADLDSLIFTRTRLAQLDPDVVIRDFSPSEYFDSDTDTCIVIGGPPWNAKYREFLPQLPFLFEPHELGEDDPLVIPQLDLILGPRWTQDSELVEDLAVFTRLTLAQGTTVILLGGCLTLGVLGAAKCFLQGARGAANAAYITERVGDQNFVLVTEARRVGGISDMADLTRTPPLLLLAATGPTSYTTLIDNTDRYLRP